MSAADADLWFELDQDPEVMRFLNDGIPTPREDINDYFVPRVEAFTDPSTGCGLWEVADKRSGEYLGWILVRQYGFGTDYHEQDNLEFGWRLKRHCWNRGIATEAVRAILKVVCSNPAIRVISSIADPDNLASIGVMKKLGMHYVGKRMHHTPKRLFQCVYYEMPAGSAETHTQHLRMDAQTLKDLEVFDASVGGHTLFELCNHTHSKSGAQALRRRMENPFSDRDRIRSVQRSLDFINTNRNVFDGLPPFITTYNVERYLQNSLPPVLADNWLDFLVQVLNIVMTDSRRYDAITQGAGVTSALIISLRTLVGNAALDTPPECELNDMLEEIRTLLARPAMVKAPTKAHWELNAWKVLRSDQIFRMDEKDTIARLLQLVFELDALISMADTTRQGGFIMPEIMQGPLAVEAEAVVHPLVPDAISNPFRLDQQQRLLFLTGPNMAGKTTYLRSIAVALYFAHLGMGVPARSFRFVPAQVLFSSIALTDNLHSGVSFFLAEGLRVKAIAEALAQGLRIVALMDEPFKGTNVKDAFDASLAIVQRFAAREDCLFMFSSHLIELSEQLGHIEHIDCRYFEAREDQGTLAFEYKLREGVSSQRLGMRVLQEQGIFELLDREHTATTYQ
jgi:DNA mismatch repair protein MutS